MIVLQALKNCRHCSSLIVLYGKDSYQLSYTTAFKLRQTTTLSIKNSKNLRNIKAMRHTGGFQWCSDKRIVKGPYHIP